MERLLDHLVELSRAGEAAGSRIPVDLDSAVREALARVEERRPQELGGRVCVSIAEGLPTVLGDRRALVQVFQHLIDNAVKFSADVDEPRIAVEVSALTATDATIVVRDNGRGVDPVHRERVFGLFERLDPAVEGSGVGLAVVKRIVGLHGGQVGLTSRGAGEGTEVWTRLPVPPKSATVDAVGATRGASRPSERRTRAAERRGT
jgi:signal transduction histidine kinase